ncbi:hypothetical protein Tco_0648600 [Tanacetum coccineum]
MIAYALCWGLNIDIVGILYDDLISKLTAGGKKGREKNICYTEYLFLVIEHLLGEAYVNKDLFPIKFYQITSVTFKQSSSSEVPLTSHMREIAKLSEEANIGNKTLGGQSADIPEVPADITNQSLEASKSAEEQVLDALRGPEGEHTADEQHDDDEFANSGLHSIGDVPLESLNQAADESPYDTESEIKFMKRFKPLHADDEPQITFIGSEKPDEEEDSNMESLPDDDVGSMSGSQSSEKELSKSEKRDADELIDEMTELNASADKPSDPLSLLQSLFIKVDQLEPNITKKVFKELQTSVPSSVSTALKETLHSHGGADFLFQAQVHHTLEEKLDSMICKLMNKQFQAFNKLEAKRFVHLQKELSKVIQTQIGKKVKETHNCPATKGPVNPRTRSAPATQVIPPIILTNDHRRQRQHQPKKSNSNTDRKEGQSKVRTGLNKVTKRLDSLLNSTKDNFNDVSDLKQQIKDLVSLLKSAKVIKETKLEGRSKENPEQLEGVNAQGDYKTAPSRDSTPPKEDRKGKGIATEEEPLKKLLPLLEQGRSYPKMLTLQQFSIAGKKMNLEEAEAQLNHLKRLANPKDAEEKSLKSLEKINIQAQAQKLAKYEAKRDKMLAEYNHYLTYRADPRKITKINYTIDRVTKDATMKIIKDNQPLSLKVMNKFGLKQLGFSEWVEIHALESKGKAELTVIGLTPAEKKRKRTSDIVKEVFVTEDIRVDGMNRNPIPPPGVVAIKGKVITEPESCIFFYNRNFDYVFQRENEFQLATTAQLIRQLRNIQRTSPEAEEMFKKLQLTIEARNDVKQARIIVRDNLDDGAIPDECKASEGNKDLLSAKHQPMIKGLANGKASASNLRDIQVEDIVKEVEDYLKTYSSAEMDIKWYVEGMLLKF